MQRHVDSMCCLVVVVGMSNTPGAKHAAGGEERLDNGFMDVLRVLLSCPVSIVTITKRASSFGVGR